MEQGWERPPRIDLTLSELSQLIAPAFPDASIAEFAVLSAGLANTNTRFRLSGHAASYVLRLYTRDAQAAHREQAVLSFLNQTPLSLIPLAPLLYTDPVPTRGAYPYSIWGFVEGTLLQDLFQTLPAAELVQIAGACGRVLASFAEYPFPQCGAFGANLEIIEDYGPPSRFVPETVHQALFKGLAGARLGAALRDTLWQTVERTSPLLRAIDDRYTLVHADYKRSNLLMRRAGSAWEVAAVLDWEFACAGPPLIDVGLFLRAGERLPPGFRDAFAEAYQDAGAELPSDWLRLSRLIDVISQVWFLNDPQDGPRRSAECIEVLKETLRVLA